jgi:hypothetical protein
MDRLTAMHVFAEVATSGSFSATADKLDMSRAMVTRYVGEMEQWLQARLLQRTTRSAAASRCWRCRKTWKKKPPPPPKAHCAGNCG